MGRRKKEPEAQINSLTPDDLIVLLAMHHAQAVSISKTLQAGFCALITAMGARPDPAQYPDPSVTFMDAFDEMTGEPEEGGEVPESDDSGATTGK